MIKPNKLPLTDLTLSSIRGYESQKKEVSILSASIKKALSSKDPNEYFPRGVVFSGSPGLGKTLFAKVLIKEVGLPTYIIDGTSISSSIGQACKKINAIFKAAAKHAPSVIFIDEVHRMIPSESFFGGFASDTTRSLLSCLLTNLDGIENRRGIFVVMTCNDTDEIDAALTRPGRIDKQINFYYPNYNDRVDIIKYYASKDPVLKNKDLDIETIAKKTKNISCAGLMTLVSETSVCLTEDIEQGKTANTVFFERILARNNINLSQADSKSDLIDSDKLINTAIHEIGHALVSFAVNGKWADIALSNTVGSVVGGITMEEDDYNDEQDGEFLDLKRIRERYMVLLGGHVAERLFCGGSTLGCSSDMRGTQALFRIGITTGVYGYENIYLGDYIPSSPDFLTRVYKKYKEEMELADSKVVKILTKNKDFLFHLKDILVEKYYLSAQDIAVEYETFLSSKKSTKKPSKKSSSKIKKDDKDR